MKKLVTTTALFSLLLTACGSMHARLDRKLHGDNPYEKAPFYMRYVGNSSGLDRNITRTVSGLRQNPRSAALHNDLGALLLAKSFPKDAELEFQRAVDNDPKLYAAWYNLGLIRETQGDDGAAERAFRRTIDIKPGHAAARFQLGLIEEKRGRMDRAIDEYARAFRTNRSLLDVHVNPRILDTKLADQALLRAYELEHAEAGAEFQATPSGYMQPAPSSAEPSNGTVAEPPLPAPSKQPNPLSVVSPSPSTTDLTQQAPRPTSRGRNSPPPQAPQSPQAPQANPQSPQSPPSGPGPAAAPLFTLRPNASPTP